MADVIKIADLMVGFAVDPKDWRRVNDRLKRLGDKQVLIKVGIDSDKAQKDAQKLYRNISKEAETAARTRTRASNTAQKEITNEMNMWTRSRRMMQNIENGRMTDMKNNARLNARIEQQNMQNMQRNLRFNLQLHRMAAAEQKKAAQEVAREEAKNQANMRRNLQFNLQLQRQVAAAQRKAAREALDALRAETAEARKSATQVNTIANAWRNQTASISTTRAQLAGMNTQITANLARVNSQIAAYNRMSTLTMQQQQHLAQLTRQANVYNQSLTKILQTQNAITKSQQQGVSGSNMGMFLGNMNSMGGLNALGLGGAGVGMMGLTKTSALLGGLGIAAGGAAVAMNDVVKTAATLEQELKGISSVTRMGAADMNTLKVNFQEISKELPVTTTQLNDVARNAALMGVQGTANITNFTKQIALLGVATRDNNKAFQDMGQMSEEIATFLNETGTTLDNFGKDLQTVINALAAVDETTPGTISSTLRLAKYMASGAVTLGLTQSEIIALSGALSGLGANAEAGGSAVIRVLMMMERAAGAPIETFGKLAEGIGMGREELLEFMGDNPAAQAAAFAKQMGVTAEEFEKIVHTNPSEAFLLLAQGLSKAAKEGQDMTKILDSLGLANVRDIRLIDQLTVGNDLLRRSMEAATRAGQNQEALNQRVAEATDNYNDKVTKLNNTWVIFKQNVGGPVVDVLTKLIDKFNEVSEQTDATKGAIDEFAKFKPGDDGLMAWIKGLYNALKLAKDIIVDIGDRLGKMNATGDKQIKGLLDWYTAAQKKDIILKELVKANIITSNSPAEAIRNSKEYDKNPKQFEELFDILMRSGAKAAAEARVNPNSPFFLNNSKAFGSVTNPFTTSTGSGNRPFGANVEGPLLPGQVRQTIISELQLLLGLPNSRRGTPYGQTYGPNGSWGKHVGEDFFAAPGTPIYAPFTGMAKLRQDKAQGNIVDLFDSVGNRISMIHLQKYAAGLSDAIAAAGGKILVKQGQLLAYVGQTGDAAHAELGIGNSHLHVTGVSRSGNITDPGSIAWKSYADSSTTNNYNGPKLTSPPNNDGQADTYTQKEFETGLKLYNEWRRAQKDLTAKGRIDETNAMKAINAFKRTHGAAWKAIVDSSKRSEAEQARLAKEAQKYADMAGVPLATFNKYREDALKLAKLEEEANKSKDPLKINAYKNAYAEYAKKGKDAMNVFNSVSDAYRNTLSKGTKDDTLAKQNQQATDLTVQGFKTRADAAAAYADQLETLREKENNKAGDNLEKQYQVELNTNKKIKDARIAAVNANLALKKKELEVSKNNQLAQAKELFKDDPSGLRRRNTAIVAQYNKDLALLDSQAANERLVINTEMESRLTDLKTKVGKERADLLEQQNSQQLKLNQDYYDALATLEQNRVKSLEYQREEELKENENDLEAQYAIENRYALKIGSAVKDAATAKLVAAKRANEAEKAASIAKANELFKNDAKGLANQIALINSIYSKNNTAAYQEYYNMQMDQSIDQLRRFEQLADKAMQAYNKDIDETIANLGKMKDSVLAALQTRAINERNSPLLQAVNEEIIRRREDRTQNNNQNKNTLLDQEAQASSAAVQVIVDEYNRLLEAAGDNYEERLKITEEYSRKIYGKQVRSAFDTMRAALAVEEMRYQQEKKTAQENGYDMELVEQIHTNNLKRIDDDYQKASSDAFNDYWKTLNQITAEGAEKQITELTKYLDEMNGQERAALRKSLMDQKVIYQAKGEAGVKSVQAIEAALKQLDETDKDIGRNFLKTLNESADRVAKSFNTEYKSLSRPADAVNAEDAGNRAAESVDSLIEGLREQQEEVSKEYLKLENPTEQDKQAYNARLNLLNDFLIKAEALRETTRLRAQQDYQDEIDQLTNQNANEMSSNDLEYRHDMGMISDQKYFEERKNLQIKTAQDAFDAETKAAGENTDKQRIALDNFIKAKTKAENDYLKDTTAANRQTARTIAEDNMQEKSDELDFLREMELISEAEYIKRRRKMREDDALAQYNMDMIDAGEDPVKQAEAYRKYTAKVKAADREASSARKKLIQSDQEAIESAIDEITSLFGNDTIDKIWAATKQLYTALTEGATNLARVIANPGDIQAWAGLITNIFNAVDAVATYFDELDPNFKKWKEQQLELVEIQNKALSSIEKRGGKFYNGIFSSPYAAQLQSDAIAREKRANAGFWQKAGWAIFGGAPQVMSDMAAETLAKLQTIFGNLAEGITNAFEESMFQAYLTGNWDELSKNMEKDMTQMLVKPIIRTMLEAAVSTGAMGEDLKAITEAINAGNYDALPGLVDKAIRDGTAVLNGLRPTLEKLPGYGQGKEDSLEDPFSGSDTKQLFGNGPDLQFSSIPSELLAGFRTIGIAGERMLSAAQLQETTMLRLLEFLNKTTTPSSGTQQSGLSPFRL